MTVLVSSVPDPALRGELAPTDLLSGGPEPAEPDSDEALVARFVAGEDSAFEEILDRYRDRVYQLARWFLGANREMAEDAAQEVFFQVYRSAARFRRRSRFRTWLFAVTRNVCRQLARGRGRLELLSEDVAAADLPDERPDPLADMEREERQRLLRRAVSELAPHHRAVMQLRDWEDLTYKEIAEVLAIPVGTVRSRLFHARAALATALAPDLGGRGRVE